MQNFFLVFSRHLIGGRFLESPFSTKVLILKRVSLIVAVDVKCMLACVLDLVCVLLHWVCNKFFYEGRGQQQRHQDCIYVYIYNHQDLRQWKS